MIFKRLTVRLETPEIIDYHCVTGLNYFMCPRESNHCHVATFIVNSSHKPNVEITTHYQSLFLTFHVSKSSINLLICDVLLPHLSDFQVEMYGTKNT